MCLFLLSILVMAGCTGGSSSQEAKAIELVQNSKTSYGRVYDVLLEMGANHIVQKMPSYQSATDKILIDSKWSSFQADDGNIYVDLKGGTSFIGNYTDYHIQWVIKGDMNTNNARPYLYAFVMDGVPQTKGMFDTFSVTILYDLNVINEEELAVLGVLMVLNNLLF